MILHESFSRFRQHHNRSCERERRLVILPEYVWIDSSRVRTNDSEYITSLRKSKSRRCNRNRVLCDSCCLVFTWIVSRSYWPRLFTCHGRWRLLTPGWRHRCVLEPAVIELTFTPARPTHRWSYRNEVLGKHSRPLKELHEYFTVRKTRARFSPVRGMTVQ